MQTLKKFRIGDKVCRISFGVGKISDAKVITKLKMEG